MRYWLVMPAAGAGRRFGGSKQHAGLAEQTVLDVALTPFLKDSRCAGGAIALAAADPARAALAARLPAQFQLIDGGTERVHSVRNGLAALASRAGAEDWVLVHDAVRPCLSSADLSRLLAVTEEETVGALLAARVADTVKHCEGAEQRSDKTVPRDALWLAQTPQMFRHRALTEALTRALDSGRIPTDEAQAFEWLGQAPRLVEAQDGNPKITRPADLVLVTAILAARDAVTRNLKE